MHASFTEPEQLLAEESFYSWYLKSDEAAIAQWNSWIQQSPAREALAAEAVVLLKDLRLQEGNIPNERVEAALAKWQQSNGTLFMGALSTGPVVRKMPGRRRWIVAAAAAVILAVAGVGIAKYNHLFEPSAETQYGQIKEQQLPDGSEVTLNAHSKISYFNGWQEGKDREVWINGEAFFHVKKTPQKSRFIVHTCSFDIIVTGTRFNVLNRNCVTNVLLQEGSVTIRTKDGKEIYMKPGDYVELNNNNEPGKKPVEASNIVDWKDRKMVFDSTPLPEAARMIETHYGVHVVLADSSVAAKTISGMMANDNLDVLLTAMEFTREFKVERKGDTIVIRNHS
ncbi:MAG: FecR domain-containing protein [Bacteroidetes bacterium]|nr:FecR domain-containing protein [Bacteroidota bacterium]